MALRSSLPPCKKERQFTTSFQFCPQAVAVPLLSSTSCVTLKVIDVLMMVMMMVMVKTTTINSVYQICHSKLCTLNIEHISLYIQCIVYNVLIISYLYTKYPSPFDTRIFCIFHWHISSSKFMWTV